MQHSTCAVSVRCGYGEEEEEAQQQLQRTVADFGAVFLDVEDQADDEQDFDDAAGVGRSLSHTHSITHTTHTHKTPAKKKNEYIHINEIQAG